MTKTNQEILEEKWREEFERSYPELKHDGNLNFYLERDEYRWRGYLAASKKRQEEIDEWKILLDHHMKKQFAAEAENEKLQFDYKEACCEIECRNKEIAQLKAENERLSGVIERGDEIKNNWENNAYQEASHYNRLDDQNESLKKELEEVRKDHSELCQRSLGLLKEKQNFRALIQQAKPWIEFYQGNCSDDEWKQWLKDVSEIKQN